MVSLAYESLRGYPSTLVVEASEDSEGEASPRESNGFVRLYENGGAQDAARLAELSCCGRAWDLEGQRVLRERRPCD